MFTDLTWHQLDATMVLSKLVTSLKGLSEEEAMFRLQEFGLNKITVEKEENKFILFLKQFNEPLIYALIAAAIVTILMGEINDALVIIVVLIINSIIGFIQETKADNAMNSLRKMSALKAKLKRSGREIIVDAEDVVVGDIVLLESGTKISADMRIIQANSLMIDESMLTGESLHIQKNTEIIDSINVPIADKTNMAFSGTIVTRGRGVGVVVATGKNTEFGKIATMITEQEIGDSPLQLKIDKFGKYLTLSIVAIIIVIFVLGIGLRDISFKEMLLTAVGLTVSAIPEGLPIAVTVTLSIGLYKMAKRNAIIRKLTAVETLGSTTIICSDKTGTLTKNEMTVEEVYTGHNMYHISGVGYNPEGKISLKGKILIAQECNELLETLLIGLVCNESKLEPLGNKYKLIGDPTEGALITSAMKAQLHKSDLFNKTNVIGIIPFESENQYMASLVERDGKHFIYVKGSIEKILSICKTQLLNYEELEIDHIKLQKSFDRMARKGLRVLGLAYKDIDSLPKDFNEDCIIEDFVFAGMQGMMDPAREEVKYAIGDCHTAGIQVVMITGDHQVTAEVIARELGIIEEYDDKKAIVITGQDLNKTTDDELFKIVNDVNVYARVSPEHKLRIVNQLRKKGHITAMTGDGVNDAPALKSADIGIAMGSGTDVAKEASSMIVTDDNFTSIFSAVEYGRIVFDNLQNILLFVLTTSLSGILTILSTILIGLPLPFVPVQILFINLVTDGTSTVPLAFEEGDRNVIYKKPRKMGSGLITKKMATRMIITAILMTIVVLLLFIWEVDEHGGFDNPNSINYARTVAFCAFGLLQMFNAHNCRSFDRSLFTLGIFKNKLLLLIHSISITLQVILIETEIGHAVFHTVSLHWSDWAIIIGLNLMLVVFVEIVKLIERKITKQQNKKTS
jgi:Ca2+-transporting ATPase